MKKFWTSKRFWVIVLALIAVGVFICFFLFLQTKIPQEIKEKGGTISAAELPISSVYRYDFKEQNYVLDEGEGWKNSDFTRYIYDLTPKNSELDKCFYFLYDNIKKETSDSGQRKCNANLTITVGENKNCKLQGENACTLYAYAADKKGNQGETVSVTYNIDWEAPKVGEPYSKDGSFAAEISDNLKVGYCWLYLDGNNLGSMKIENGLAFFDYQIKEEESHNVFVRCADGYDAEKGDYLNFGYGKKTKTVTFENRPPQISFCKVSPAQGNKETNFSFEVEATDPDGDALTYLWDFGDEKTSDEKNIKHYYFVSGTFEPKVSISDANGEKTDCSTAWVVVGE